jgi:hypothetical protein
MCANCVIQSTQAAAGLGGPIGLLGATAASLGFNRLSAWITTREFRFATPRRVKIAGTLTFWATFIALYSMRP